MDQVDALSTTMDSSKPLTTSQAYSDSPVTLGRANIEVLQGCCPSVPIFKATHIEPGGEVPLVFSLPLGMHQAMDGPHLFRVTVPVTSEEEQI
jgi:hypothetical protein